MPDLRLSSAMAWPTGEEPSLVLFVSHRWRSTAHPDPDGRTLRTLMCLLNALEALAQGLDPLHPAQVPDLHDPAMLQASVLLHRLLERAHLDGDATLDHVAVFFDYSCLPQGEEREDRQQLMDGLACFADMIPDPRVALIALREPSDDYVDRSWCVAESVLALSYDDRRPWIETFPMRLDLEPRRLVVTFPDLRTAMTLWTANANGRARITPHEFRAWLDLVQLCVDWHGRAREEANASLHHSPDIAERSFRLWVRITLGLAESGDGEADLAPLIHQAAASEGLRCSDPADIVPTALLILAGLRWEELNRRVGHPCGTIPDGPDFWRQCLARHLEGRPLRVRVKLRRANRPGELTPPSLTLLPK